MNRFSIIMKDVAVTVPFFWEDEEVDEIMEDVLEAWEDAMAKMRASMTKISVNLVVEEKP